MNGAPVEPAVPGVAGPAPKRSRVLVLRVVSGVLFVPLLVLLARAGGMAWLGFVALQTVLGLEEFYRMARAKGLRSGRVVFGHALRNSVIPLVTVLGPLIGYMITGSFIIETIYSVPGVARYYVASVVARDYTVVMGLTVLLAVMIVFANLAVDIAHRMLDPRMREA